MKAKVFNETQSGGVVANETVIHPGGQRPISLFPFPFAANTYAFLSFAVDGVPFGGIGPSGCTCSSSFYMCPLLTRSNVQMDTIPVNTHLTCSRTCARRSTRLPGASPLCLPQNILLNDRPTHSHLFTGSTSSSNSASRRTACAPSAFPSLKFMLTYYVVLSRRRRSPRRCA